MVTVGRHSRDFRPGCGAIAKCWSLSSGFATIINRSAIRKSAWHSTVSIFTAYSHRSVRCSIIWTELTPKQPGLLVSAMAASLPGKQRLQYTQYDGARFLDAVQNARLVANAERYYRVMYYGSNESWNHRDQHMFDTLELLLGFHGATSKAVIWEHNSHLGNAAATEMGAGGQTNVGQLCRQRFGKVAYLIGQGTDHGTVAAAANWDEAVEFMSVRPGHPGSYENVFHDSGVEAFCLHLREPRKPDLRAEMAVSRLERAIGVVYRPDTELASHYFNAILSHQFDEFIWFDHSKAVRPISNEDAGRFSPEHPFSLKH
jgi:erythromycin esterase-like protein